MDSVKVPYMAFCVVFVLLAAVFFFIRLPHIGEGKIEPGAGALRYPHVVLGIIGIFMYVGGEVAVGSAIINFLGRPEVAGLGEMDASKFVSLYWGGLLIGRLMGAVELSEMRKAGKQALLVIIPLLAFLFLWFAQSTPLDAMRESSNAQIFALWRERFVLNWPVFRTYLPFIGLCWLLFLFGKSQAGRTLMIFMTTVVVLLLTAILAGGKVAMWCVVAVGLFSSIGWSNTFSLAIEGVGRKPGQDWRDRQGDRLSAPEPPEPGLPGTHGVFAWKLPEEPVQSRQVATKVNGFSPKIPRSTAGCGIPVAGLAICLRPSCWVCLRAFGRPRGGVPGRRSSCRAGSVQR